VRKLDLLRAAHIMCAAVTLILFPAATRAEGEADAAARVTDDFPTLPLPPVIEGLIGFPQTCTKARSTYLPLITRAAEERGLPPALADAVAKVESGFNPNVVGGVGEVGLMQLRPETAAMLGHQGGMTSLFDPETNVRLGVTYLSRAWHLAKGDVCRALMKYRAGWGEERMTALSIEYCRRARGHLAAIGSPLAGGAVPTSSESALPFSAQPAGITQPTPAPRPRPEPATMPHVAQARAPQPRPSPAVSRLAQARAPQQSSAPAGLRSSPARVPRLATTLAHQNSDQRNATPPTRPERIRVASLGAVKLSEAQAQALQRAREQERARAEQRRQLWAEHEKRMQAITAKLMPTQLKIMSGL